MPPSASSVLREGRWHHVNQAHDNPVKTELSSVIQSPRWDLPLIRSSVQIYSPALDTKSAVQKKTAKSPVSDHQILNPTKCFILIAVA